MCPYSAILMQVHFVVNHEYQESTSAELPSIAELVWRNTKITDALFGKSFNKDVVEDEEA